MESTRSGMRTLPLRHLSYEWSYARFHCLLLSSESLASLLSSVSSSISAAIAASVRVVPLSLFLKLPVAVIVAVSGMWKTVPKKEEKTAKTTMMILRS